MNGTHLLTMWACAVCAATGVCQPESRPAYPSDLSPAERSAFYAGQLRWPPIEQGGLVYEPGPFGLKYSVPNGLAFAPSVTLSLEGRVRWTPEAGDVLIAAPLVVGRVLDGEGRVVSAPQHDAPLASGIVQEWMVDCDRSYANTSPTASVSAAVRGMQAVPSGISLIEGGVRVWRLEGATTTIVPLQTTTSPIELAPGVSVSLLAYKDDAGQTVVDLDIVQPTPHAVHGVEFPAVLLPESTDFLSPDGLVARGVSWGTAPRDPDREKELEAAGQTQHSWRLQTWGGKPFPADASVRIRVVPDATYEPIPFVIRDIPTTGELPLPIGAAIPLRTASRGPLTLTFRDPPPDLRRGSSVSGSTLFLHALLTTSDTQLDYAIAAEPVIETARDSAGREVAIVPLRKPADSQDGDIRCRRLADGWRQSDLTIQFRIGPDFTGIGEVIGTWPIWRVTKRTEHTLAAKAVREPISITPEVRVWIRQVTRSGSETRARIRWYVERRPSEAGPELPILAPLYYREDSNDETVRLTHADQSTSGRDTYGQWEQRTYSVPSTSPDLEFVVSIAEALEDLSIKFSVTDMPISR